MSHRVLNDLVELFQREVINLEVSKPSFLGFLSAFDPREKRYLMSFSTHFLEGFVIEVIFSFYK